MKLIKYTGRSSIGKTKFRVALFKCPICKDEVEKRASVGKNMKACTTKCFNSSRKIRGARKRRVFISKHYYILCPKHPNRTKKNYVAEHRLVMEEHLGRYLTNKEIVHHINHEGLDNRIENLQLMTASEHMKLHAKKKKRGNDGKFK